MSMTFWITYITTVIGMEGITWLTHKYVMHGFLWYLHEDHHNKRGHRWFEKNDFFFVIFAIPSMACIFYGRFVNPDSMLLPLGLGVMTYGFLYFIVHEVIIHQRLPKYVPTSHPYFTALKKAHKDHHKNTGKEDSVCFGMLWVPFKYFKQAFEKQSVAL